MHKSILLAILPLAVFAAKEPRSWPVTGVVTEECAVAVSAKPMLYSAATQGRFYNSSIIMSRTLC